VAQGGDDRRVMPSRRGLIDTTDDPAPWTDPLAVPRPALDGDTTADVLVVGGGLTGLWTAYYLLDADPSLDVLVVEAGATGQDERGLGTCSARLGLGPQGLADRFGDEASGRARALLRDAVVEVGGVAAVEELECGFAFGGEVMVAADDAALARFALQAAAAVRWGDETDVLTRDQVVARVRVDESAVVGGTWSAEAARLDPGRLARGLADTVVARGGRVVDGTRVARLSDGAAVTTHGTVRAGTLVDTRPPGPARTAATLATPPLGASLWTHLGMAHAELVAHSDGLRLVRSSDDRLVAGRVPVRGGLTTRAAAALVAPVRSSDALHDALVGLLPVLLDVPVTHAWQRPLAAPGALPDVGLVDGRAWARSGGTGPAAANVAARGVAELVTGTVSDLTTAPWVRAG